MNKLIRLIIGRPTASNATRWTLIRLAVIVSVALVLPIGPPSIVLLLILGAALCIVGYLGLRLSNPRTHAIIMILFPVTGALITIMWLNAVAEWYTHRAYERTRVEDVQEVRERLLEQVTSLFDTIATAIPETLPPEGTKEAQSTEPEGEPTDEAVEGAQESIKDQRRSILKAELESSLQELALDEVRRELLGRDELAAPWYTINIARLRSRVAAEAHDQNTSVVTDRLIDRATRYGLVGAPCLEGKLERFSDRDASDPRTREIIREVGGEDLYQAYLRHRSRNGKTKVALSSAVENLKALVNEHARILVYPAPRFVMLCNGLIQFVTFIAFWIGVFLVLRAYGRLPVQSRQWIREYQAWDHDDLRGRVAAASVEALTEFPAMPEDHRPVRDSSPGDTSPPISALPIGSQASGLLGKLVIPLGRAWRDDRQRHDLPRGVTLLWATSAPRHISGDGDASGHLTAAQIITTLQVDIKEPLERAGVHVPTVVNVMERVLHAWGTSGEYADINQALNTATHDEKELYENELEFCRYIVWLLPSIGFVGTIVGIGSALMKSERMVNAPPELQGQEVSSVTDALGLAFDTTLVALVLSIVIVALQHTLQFVAGNQIDEIKRFVKSALIERMRPQ